jgi:hypothetical protein
MSDEWGTHRTVILLTLNELGEFVWYFFISSGLEELEGAVVLAARGASCRYWVFADVASEEPGESLGVLAGEDDGAGEDAVAAGVPGGGVLPWEVLGLVVFMPIPVSFTRLERRRWISVSG